METQTVKRMALAALAAATMGWTAAWGTEGESARSAAEAFEAARAAGGAALEALPGELKALAKAGDADAWNLLGICHGQGLGTKADEKEAFKCHLKAAEGGDAWGAYNAAVFYREGTGTRRNADEAVKWMVAAWERGIVKASWNVAWWLCEDEGNSHSDAAEMDPQAVENAALWALTGLEASFAEAGEEYFEDLARRGIRGDSEAREQMAWRLFRGKDGNEIIDGMPQDADTRRNTGGVLLFDLAIRGQLRPAAWKVFSAAGNLGEGGEVPEWFRALKPEGTGSESLTIGDFLKFMAAQGCIPLGHATLFGLYDPELLEAKERMASRGDWRAALELGDFWEEGSVLPPKGLEEARWRLATSWDGHSQYRLGCLYSLGKGGRGNAGEEASWWFAQCAETGGADAGGANNALLLRWLEGGAQWRAKEGEGNADGEKVWVSDPESEDWEELGAELAGRAEKIAESGRAFYAPVLLAAKALKEGDGEGAKGWIGKMPEEEREAILRAWPSATGDGGDEGGGPFAEGVRALLGAGGEVDWRSAMAAFLEASAEGNAMGGRLAYLLMCCEWWDGRDEEDAARMAEELAEAGDGWMAVEAGIRAMDECRESGNWTEMREAMEPWIALADDAEWAERTRDLCDLLSEHGGKIRTVLEKPLTRENLEELTAMNDAFSAAVDELLERIGEKGGDEETEAREEDSEEGEENRPGQETDGNG